MISLTDESSESVNPSASRPAWYSDVWLALIVRGGAWRDRDDVLVLVFMFMFMFMFMFWGDAREAR